MPTISVIVPVYNVEKYLRSCIDSILAQTYTDIEVLLVDDGSTDGSGAICDEYAQKDSRVRVFHKENGGVSSARNLGLDKALGSYFLLCDSDDAIHPQLCEMAITKIQKNGLDCLIYGYRCVDEETTLVEIQYDIPKIENIELMNCEQVLQEILRGNRFRMLACNKLYKAELWENIRYPVGRKYGDDTSVTYRLMDLCQKVGYVQTPYYYYRMRQGSALHSNISEANLQLFDAYNELLTFFASNHPKMMEYACNAYIVRIFDFLHGLKNNPDRVELVSMLYKRIKEKAKTIFKHGHPTIKQKLLIRFMMLSPKLFWILYAIC